MSLQFFAPVPHTWGAITKLPAELPGRRPWLVPPLSPTVSYSCSHDQYELVVTSA